MAELIMGDFWRGRGGIQQIKSRSHQLTNELSIRFAVDPTCSFVDVTAAVPCLGLEANPTEEQCRGRHQECCILIKHNGVIKCFRKRTQPNSGIHRNITSVFLCVYSLFPYVP